jgi:hypothetical protein
MAFQGLSRKAMAVPLAWAVLALSVGCTVTPSPPTPTETACPDPVIERGDRWREMGGPNAFIVVNPFVAHPRFQKIWVRFAEPSEEPRSIEAELLGSELREDGVVQAAIEPHQWEPGAGPPEDLPGSVHLAIIRLPRLGCWQLVLRAGSDVVGRARVEVQPAPDQAAESPAA